MTTPIGGVLTQALHSHRSADPGDVYDETLRVVATRAAAAQSLCKADIGSLVMWKRITASARWAGTLGMTPDAEVQAVTGNAWALANNAQLPAAEAGLAAFRELRKLPGLGGTGALASAVLVACAPDRMAVWDQRVSSTLEAMGRRPKFTAGFYGRYLEELDHMIEDELDRDAQRSWKRRDVELALYAIGGRADLLAQVRR
ncbi:hypothetical protein BJ986_002253 [Phycicoccus badiiscoriae]|uniref:Uncharacterized protein n=1 Tax=Pedococcus badiiscoriae TaxID=642776 RepID=A0A852WR40_9MICO|nr:hypothetical protein [Pedococcus badiiscoriae]NYG07766.1 hypothetical protein [Pedococcus badiiscoriae]